MASVGAMMASAGTVRALENLPSSGLLTRSRITLLNSKRTVNMRCMAEPEPKSDEAASPAASKPSVTAASDSTVTPIATAPAEPRVPKVSTKFQDIFAFAGPGPETINGRLAMLGFVGALVVELGTGNSFTNQLQKGGLELGLFTAALFTTASLIPMFQGVTAESRSKSFWSSEAEKWNGRLAMVGLVALAITEYVNGSPLV